MDFYNLAFIFAFLKIIAVNQSPNFLCMVCVLTGNKHYRLHIVQIVVAAILTQHSLAMLVEHKSIADFHFFDIILVIACHVGASHYNWDFQIAFNRATSQVIGIDNI